MPSAEQGIEPRAHLLRRSLGLTSPASFAFTALTLNGHSQTTTGTATFTPDDETNSGGGWNLAAYATAFTDASAHTLPAPRSPSRHPPAPPTHARRRPTRSRIPPAAGNHQRHGRQDLSRSCGHRAGGTNVALTFSIAVPGNQRIASSSPDTFSATMTLSLASGP